MYKDLDCFSATFGFCVNFFSVNDLMNLFKSDVLDATSLGGIKPRGVLFRDLLCGVRSFDVRTSSCGKEAEFSRTRFSLKDDDMKCAVLLQINPLSEAGMLSESDDQSTESGNGGNLFRFPLSLQMTSGKLPPIPCL
jgi:hypothetical protein